MVGEQNYDEYVFHSPNPPVVVGDFLSEIGGTDWNEQTTLTLMNDEGIEGDSAAFDGIYTYFGSIPAGEYEYKIVLNNNWIQNTTGENLFLSLNANSDVYFYYDMSQNIIWAENAGVSVDEQEYPQEEINLILSNPHPSPFKDQLMIDYYVRQSSKVTMEIFNIKGQKILTLIDNELKHGANSVNWNGCDLNNKKIPSGVYLIQLSTSSELCTEKVVFFHK